MFEIFEQFGSNVNNFVGTSMYTFAMSYFCLFKVSRKTDDAFSQKMEWKLHAFIFMSIFAAAVTGLASKSFNSNIHGQYCSINTGPEGCLQKPEVFGPCDEKITKYAIPLLYTIFFGTTLLCLFGITVCMLKICFRVMVNSRNTRNDNKSQQDAESSLRTIQTSDPPLRSQSSQQPLRFSQGTIEEQESIDTVIRRYRRQFFSQALLYVLVYIVTHLFHWIGFIIVAILRNKLNDVFVYAGTLLYPLGGMFNILVYCRPKVLSLKRNNPQYSWIKSFFLVVRAGGTVPMVVVEGQRMTPSPVEIMVRRRGIVLDREDRNSRQPLSSDGMQVDRNSRRTPMQLEDGTSRSNGLLPVHFTGADDDLDLEPSSLSSGGMQIDLLSIKAMLRIEKSSSSSSPTTLFTCTDDSDRGIYNLSSTRAQVALLEDGSSSCWSNNLEPSFAGMGTIAEGSEEEDSC